MMSYYYLRFIQKDIGRLRNNVVDLVGLIIERPSNEPISADIVMVVMRSIFESWPVRKHDHFTTA